MSDRLYDIEGTRERLGGIGRTTLFELFRTREIGSVKIGRRRLVPQSQIEAYIAKQLEGVSAREPIGPSQ